jgi:hypothetical protein
MCNAIYQNRLALDYLLASEGGVCGKFNLRNWCLQIDDEGKVIEEKSPVSLSRLGKVGTLENYLENAFQLLGDPKPS